LLLLNAEDFCLAGWLSLNTPAWCLHIAAAPTEHWRRAESNFFPAPNDHHIAGLSCIMKGNWKGYIHKSTRMRLWNLIGCRQRDTERAHWRECRLMREEKNRPPDKASCQANKRQVDENAG